MNHLPHTAIHLAAFAITVCLGLPTQAQVFDADIEPNNTFTTAIPITLGVPFEGQLNVIPGDRIDLYSLILPDDGVLLLYVESEQAGDAIPFLTIRGYALEDSIDHLMSISAPFPVMGAFGTVYQDTTYIPCMKAGFHYLRVGGTFEDTTTTPRSYRITAIHRPMAFADDAEPNNDMATAIPLLEGVPAEGRLSVEWPYNDPADLYDFYVLHKTAEGPLVIHTEVAVEGDLGEEDLSFIVTPAMTLASVGAGMHGVPVSDIAIFPTLTDTGTYYVQWYNPLYSCACYRFSWSVGTVGIQEGTHPSGFSVHPNPTNGPVTLNGKNIERVDVRDASGQLVMVHRTKGREPYVWDASALPAGTYQLIARMTDGTTLMRRLVLQR